MDSHKPTLIDTLTVLALTAPEKSYVRATMGDDYRSEMLWALFVVLREHDIRKIVVDLRTLSLTWNYYTLLPNCNEILDSNNPHYRNMKRIFKHCHERLTS